MDYNNTNIPSEINKYLNWNKENLGRICKKMFEELANGDFDDIVRKSKSEIYGNNKIKLPFFGEEVLVDPGSQKIYWFSEKYLDKKECLDVFSSLIILHYLTISDGSLLEGKWISYRELPNGLFYGKTIPGVLKPLVSRFENSFEEFTNKAIRMGGKRTDDFNNGVIIYPFKMFPIVMILDEKDDEFEANIRILFDGSATHYIKTDVIKTIIVYVVNKFIL